MMAFCMNTVCNKDHGCKDNSHCDDNDLLGEMAQFTVGERGAMREPFSQSENTAGERRHSHILEANRTWEPAYFLFFISTNRVLHPWESCRSLCRRNTGFDTRPSLSFGDAQWVAGVLWRDFSKKDSGAQSADSQYQRSKWFEGYLNWIFTIMFG